MGILKKNWQHTDYVLSYFSKTKHQARNEYESFVKDGLTQGRRKEFTGGGFIRSTGGWSEVSNVLNDRDHVMSDERILGDSDFVESIISKSEEQFEKRHKLKRQGYDLDRIAERVAEVLNIEPDLVFSKGRQKNKSTSKKSSLFLGGQRTRHASYRIGKEIGIKLRCYRIFG